MSAIEPGCIIGEGISVCGPGGFIVQDSRDYPCCDNHFARVVTRWPNSAYYGPTDHCECGDTWSDGYRHERPFARGWRAKSQARFEKEWADAMPAGTRPNYTRDAWLESLTLPDGTIVTR